MPLLGSISEKVGVAVATAAVLAIAGVIGNQVTAGGLVRLMGGVTQDEMEAFGKLPKGVVLAFDIREGCPEKEGWQPFKPAISVLSSEHLKQTLRTFQT